MVGGTKERHSEAWRFVISILSGSSVGHYVVACLVVDENPQSVSINS